MFIDFFYYLRRQGIKVSMDEWLTLMDALDKGLAYGSFTHFYYLCRGVLIKSEAEFSKFNRAFLSYFEEIGFEDEENIPQELMDWLNTPIADMDNYDDWAAHNNQKLAYSEIRRMLQERLAEQDSRHDGGSYWVGTGGMSTFGNAGNSPVGIRVGGQSMHRRAFQVAGDREFDDFRDDVVLDLRQFQVALRRLRQYSTRADAPKDELDVDGTIRATCDQAGRLKVVYDRPRKNTVKLLLLMDSGGSMDVYRKLCTTLFQAVSTSSHFKDLKIYYFHNCVYSQLYNTPTCSRRDTTQTDWVLQNLDSEYKVIILGDAMMDPYELTGSYNYGGPSQGMSWLKKIKKRFPRNVWITPMEMTYPRGSYWRKSYDIISEEFDMYSLTIHNLEAAFKKLIGD